MGKCPGNLNNEKKKKRLINSLKWKALYKSNVADDHEHPTAHQVSLHDVSWLQITVSPACLKQLWTKTCIPSILSSLNSSSLSHRQSGFASCCNTLQNSKLRSHCHEIKKRFINYKNGLWNILWYWAKAVPLKAKYLAFTMIEKSLNCTWTHGSGEQ